MLYFGVREGVVFGFRVVGVILLLVLCVVALSAVFDGGVERRWGGAYPGVQASFSK
jgi:hypothetical protein